MYIANFASEEFESLDNRCKQIVADITAQLSISKESHFILSGKEFQPGPMSLGKQKVYVVKQGRLQCADDKQVLFWLEENDLIGAGGHLMGSGIRMFAEQSVVIDEFEREALLKSLQADAQQLSRWSEFTALQLDLHGLYLTRMASNNPVARPVTRSYAAGEVIIEQGSQGKDVYALLDGHAEVWVDGVKVGAIYMDEIFGAIAALTGTARTASVVAASACMVQILPRANFMELMSYRPKTVLKMVEDMARVIVSLNHKVIELQKLPGAPKEGQKLLPPT